jgi:tetratricopeptide (TPR) repeat protein
VIVDYGLISSIRRFNAFKQEHVDEIGVPLDLATENNLFNKSGNGIWLEGSLFNHSCLENTNRVFHGDFMFVYANQRIAKGTEINLSYVEHSTLPERQKVFKSFAFDCECSLCVAEKSLPKARMDKLLKLSNEFKEMKPRTLQPDSEIFADLEVLIKKIEKAYGEVGVIYQHIPYYPKYVLGVLFSRYEKYSKAIRLFSEIIQMCGLDEGELLRGNIVGKSDDAMYIPLDLGNVVSELAIAYQKIGSVDIASILVQKTLVVIEKAHGLDARMALVKHNWD